jgi:hypothetical protein
MIQDPNKEKEKESQITSMKAATESDAKEKEPVMKPITEFFYLNMSWLDNFEINSFLYEYFRDKK